jgi:hypothetical protein
MLAYIRAHWNNPDRAWSRLPAALTKNRPAAGGEKPVGYQKYMAAVHRAIRWLEDLECVKIIKKRLINNLN